MKLPHQLMRLLGVNNVILLSMKHFYAHIGDIDITYGDISIVDGYKQVLPIYVERERQDGDFDFAEGIAPACTFQRSSGFSEFELQKLQQTLRNNLLLLWKNATAEVPDYDTKA